MVVTQHLMVTISFRSVLNQRKEFQPDTSNDCIPVLKCVLFCSAVKHRVCSATILLTIFFHCLKNDRELEVLSNGISLSI